MTVPSKLLTAAQAANILDVRVSRVYDLAKTGRLPVVRIGRQLRIDADGLAAFIARGGEPLAGGWRREAM